MFSWNAQPSFQHLICSLLFYKYCKYPPTFWSYRWCTKSPLVKKPLGCAGLFCRQSLLIMSPLMWKRWMCTSFPEFCCPFPSCYPLGSSCFCSSWPGWQSDRKTLALLTEPGWTPAGFHCWQQKERQSSQSDKHSRCVGWRQSSMEMNLLTEHLISCLTEK